VISFFGMVIGYARVSTDEQTNAAQLSALRKAGCKRIYEEKDSGRDADRPELKQCLHRLDEGDTLTVWRLDRLGRSLRDLLEIVSGLEKRKVNFVSLTERFDTSTAAGRLIFHFFASLTQFERELIRERTKAGLAAARARGRLGGRKRKLDEKQMAAIRTLWDGNRHSKNDIGARFGVSKSTIDRIVRPEPLKNKVQAKALKTPSKRATRQRARN
jgi:DNA invertase Pin-like site-specific DNA recombinase